jgi:FkbM family methyltransferase
MHTFPPLRCICAIYRVLGLFGFSVKKRLVRFTMRGLRHPLYFRYDTSDLSAFSQIFISNELAALGELSAPTWIVDCGANVGYASIWFLNRFPQAKVIALEPDPANFSVLVKNVAPYGDRVIPILGALWKSDGNVAIHRVAHGSNGGGEWATNVHTASENGEVVVPAFSLTTVLSWIPEQRIDLLKMDIEGAETEVFSQPKSTTWQHVTCLAVELHNPDAEARFARLEGFFQPCLRSRAGEYSVLRRTSSGTR